VTGRTALDLFCGAGGLASGFAQSGFKVTGVDNLEVVPEIFKLNGLGLARQVNLHSQTVNGGYDLVVGGPPCRPWSVVNVVRRGNEHRSYRLLSRFATHVLVNHPKAFLMENVPPARPDVERVASRLRDEGYDLALKVVQYSDYGAPTSRRRLILFGSRRSDAQGFFEELDRHRRPAKTVRDAIGYLADAGWGSAPDHVYPNFQTIENYMDYYETGKYGWYRLSWEKPAPSFGNVVKTYTLHPSSWEAAPPRVISIREALCLMGFDQSFAFPEGMGMGRRYQMVADTVSPVFAHAAAKAVDQVL
jgi:DNA (cytosine-5)-methyltransferase 1